MTAKKIADQRVGVIELQPKPGKARPSPSDFSEAFPEQAHIFARKFLTAAGQFYSYTISACETWAFGPVGDPASWGATL
jgi:hypothetical protein